MATKVLTDRDEFLIERDTALLEAYQKVIEKHGKLSRVLPKLHLYEEAVNSPAPRFYISPAQAGRIITNLLKGNTKPEQIKAARNKGGNK